MNEYTLAALALDLGIIYYLCKIYGKYILNRKKFTEITLITLSIITITVNTMLSSTDFVSLVVSTVTALAIATGTHLIFRKTMEELNIEIELVNKFNQLKKRLLNH